MSEIDKGRLEIIRKMICKLSSEASLYSMDALKKIDFDKRMSALCAAYNRLKEELENDN